MAEPDEPQTHAPEPAPRGFATRAIRAAHRAPDVAQRPTSVPIYQSVTFASSDAEELGAVLTRRTRGYAYGRVDNPTVVALAEAVAELEGAGAGFALASGMGAIHAAVGSLVSAGDRIVAPRATYGTTHVQFDGVLRRMGVTTEFVDATDLDAVATALRTFPAAVVYAETIANPTIVVADIAALAGLAHRHGARLIVDNTFASPYLCRPVELGADLVVEAATKYLSGHSDVMAGIVAGSRSLVDAVREFQVDTGASLDPHAAWLVLRGLSTLALRMERHATTAAALADWLAAAPGVRHVFHPSQPSHPQRAVAARQLAAGGGMMAIELEGGREAGAAFIDAISIPERTASLGSVFTMVVHPPSTTHRQLDDAALTAAGITPGLLRLSVGLEDLDDLIADFERGLAAARAATATNGTSGASGTQATRPETAPAETAAV